MAKLRMYFNILGTKPYYKKVSSPKEARIMINAIANFVNAKVDEGVFPDHCSTAGLEEYDEEEKDWVSWYDENGLDIDESPCNNKEKRMTRENLREHCEKTLVALKNMPTSKTYQEHEMVLELLNQTEWIPVSERLPEDRNSVFVTAYWHENYQVMEASYYGDGIWWCVPFNNCGKHMRNDLHVIAWRPLPKRYKECEE